MIDAKAERVENVIESLEYRSTAYDRGYDARVHNKQRMQQTTEHRHIYIRERKN